MHVKFVTGRKKGNQKLSAAANACWIFQQRAEHEFISTSVILNGKF
jgi:hypothetical protein